MSCNERYTDVGASVEFRACSEFAIEVREGTENIDDELVKAGVSEADRNRIVTDLEAGKIKATTEREDVRRFT